MSEDERNLRYELALQYTDRILAERLKDAQAAHDQAIEQAALDLEARRESIKAEYDEQTLQAYLNFVGGSFSKPDKTADAIIKETTNGS